MMNLSKLRTAVVVVGALLFPGLGHLILGKWVRAVLFALAVLSLFCLGLAVEGRLHGLEASEFIAMLYFFADASNGLPYILARNWGYGGGNPQNQSFEYGNTFLAVAGLLNLLVVLNAFDIAVGRKK
jgi:hypothetical protein